MSTDDLRDRPHALYRFFDRGDRLLYVGLTANPARRFAQHADRKPWWTDVARITLEQHPDRASVMAAEQQAIRRERPLHNVQHAGRSLVETAAIEPAGGSDQSWPVAVDDCVALGLADDECVVGLVTATTEWGVRLALLSFLTGMFDEEITVRWSDVLRIKHGYLMPRSARKRGGYTAETVFDCEPLGEFQTWWKAGRGEAGREAVREHRQLMRELAR